MTHAPTVPSARRLRHRLRIRPMVLLGLTRLAGTVLCSALAELIRPYGITERDLPAGLAPPLTPDHRLGTDEPGRDVPSRLLRSIRTSLVMASGASLLSAAFGATLASRAARFRGGVEPGPR